jgi:hypothetical protein
MSIYEELARLLAGNLELICIPFEHELVFCHDKKNISWKAVLSLREDEEEDVFVYICAAFLHGENEIACLDLSKFYQLLHRQ